MEHAYLLVISDAAALAWILGESRMAFPDARRRQAELLAEGDELFIYTTRGCFNNPSRDRGRIVGYARASSQGGELDEPVTIGYRTFTLGCNLDIVGVTPPRTGVELAPIVHQLEAFPDPASWSSRLRRPPLMLSAADAELIRRLLAPLIEPVANHLSAYVQETRPSAW